ncbi:MAG: Bax inhibitor-1/YccA family protein [Pseudomonadota bacterium]
MADYREQAQFGAQTRTRTAAEIDEGLRSYMLGIYNYMAIAMVITGGVAMFVANMAMNNPAVAQVLYGSPLKWVVMLAPLAFILVLSFGINKLSAGAAQMVFWAYAAVMGLSLSSIFLLYTGASIAQTFFVTAAAFGALSLYGYTTKRSLSGMGSFLMMGLFGLIIAMVVNIFLQSSALAFAVNVIGVLIFAGLTAYDTQRLKETYDMVVGNTEAMAKSSIMGALSLYLNFVNMFMFLLSFMGDRE